MVDTVREESVELLRVEYFEGAVGWDLVDDGGVPAVVLVTVRRLDEDCGVLETLRDHVSVVMIELDTFPDIFPRLLHDAVPVEVGEKAQTEPLPTAGVCEAVHRDCLLGGVVVLSYSGVELVVGDGAPVLGLAVHDGLQLQGGVREGRGDGGEVSHSLAEGRPVTVGVVSDVAGGRGSDKVSVVEVVKTPGVRVVPHVKR